MSELADVCEDILRTQAQIRALDCTTGSIVGDARAAMRVATETLTTIRRICTQVREGAVSAPSAIATIDALLS